MKDEELLIQKAKNGEREAFGKLYDHYMPKIYRFVLFKISIKHDAEDLTHQVFSHALEHIGSYEPHGFPLSSWLYRIASNTVIDYYRTFKNNLDIENVPEEKFAEQSGSETKFDSSLNMERVLKAIQKLDSDQQNVIIMKFVDELSNKEIAKAIEKTEGAIRVIQHRALKQLKNFLLDE